MIARLSDVLDRERVSLPLNLSREISQSRQDAMRREFDRQVSNLVTSGYPALAGLRANDFLALVEPLRDRLPDIPTGGGDRIPFVLVVRSEHAVSGHPEDPQRVLDPGLEMRRPPSPGDLAEQGHLETGLVLGRQPPHLAGLGFLLRPAGTELSRPVFDQAQAGVASL